MCAFIFFVKFLNIACVCTWLLVMSIRVCNSNINLSNYVCSADAAATLYVTYSLAGREHKTHGVEARRKPFWGYEKCVKLNVDSIRTSKVSEHSFHCIKYKVFCIV